MNKVFKVVWSKAKNCYVVASELAKRRTKSPKSSVFSRTLVVGVLLSLLYCPWVIRDAHATEYPVNGSNAVASGTNATAWGGNATALANNSTAFGSHSLTGLYRYDGKLAAVRDFSTNGKWCIVDIFTDKKLATNFNSYSEALAELTPIDYVNKEGRYLYKGEEAYLDTIVDTDGKTKYVLKRASDNEVLVIGDWYSTSVTYKYDTLAPVNGGLSFGEQSIAADSQATAFGYRTTAAGKQATAFGYYTKAFGNYALSHGYQNIAVGPGSTVFGFNNIAGNLFYNDIPVKIVIKTVYDANLDRNVSYYYLSSIEDGSLLTNGYGSFEEAYQQVETRVDSGQQAYGSTVFGSWNHVNGNYSTAFGSNNVASNSYSTAFGAINVASGSYSTAFGTGNFALGSRATVFGSNNIAGGNLSYNGTPVRVTWNTYTDADGKKYNRFFLASIEDDTPLTAEYETKDEAIAKATVTNVDYATAFGAYSQASGTGATAFGYRNIAKGAQSTAFGQNSKAIANYSIAMGSGSEARGNDSIAIIGGKVANTANYSAAIGQNAETTLNHTVALGSDSATTSKSGLDTAYLRNGTTGTAWISNRNAIAVGNDATVTRQITGVAAGSKDTDAANIAQLKRLGNRDASNIGSNFGGTDAQNKANSQAWGTALGTGSVASGNKELVTGGTAYTELRPTDGKFVKQANTTAANLTALDTAAANAIKGMTANGKTITYTKGDGTTGTVAINGTGTVSSGNTELINGGTAYTELRPADGTYVKQANTTAANLTALDKQTKANTEGLAAEITNRTNADTALSNRIGTLSADGNYIKKDNSAAQNLKAIDDKIGAASVANGTYIKTGNTVNANLKALDTQLKSSADAITALDNDKAEKDASNVAEYAQEWADAIGTGTVTADDTKLVTGKTVYEALHGQNLDLDVNSVTAKTINGDNVTVNENLTVMGDTHLHDTYVDGILDVTKEATFHDNVTIEKDLTVDGKATVGTLEVEGNGKVDGNWTVMGNESVEGNSHIYGNQTVDGKSTVGSQEVLGDSIINGNQTVKKDLTVEGTSNLKGDVYMNSNAEIGENLTVKGDSDLQGNAHVGKDLTVDDNVDIGKDLHVVGESKLDGTVTMGSDASVVGNFSVAGNTELKDTLIDGILEVNKEATFHDNVAMDKDLAVAGNASIGKDLTVEGTSALKGNTTIGTEDAPADLLVNGNATVTGDSDLQGNANIGKDLTVEGTSTLKGDVFMNSNAEIGKDLHVVGMSALDGDVTAGSNMTVKGDTFMEGNADIGENLHVKGTSQLDGNTTIGTEEAPADLYVTGNSNIGKNLTVQGTLDVMDNTHLHKDLQVDGNTNIGGDIHISGNEVVDGDSNIKGNQLVEKNLTVNGDTNIAGNTIIQKNLTVDGDSNIKGNETIEKNLSVGGDTNIAGNTIIQKNLTVEGDSNIKGSQLIERDLAVNGNSNVHGNGRVDKDFSVGGNSDFEGNVHMRKDLKVDGNASIGGTLTADRMVVGGRDVNREFSRMDNRIDSVGANAAALAGLHPSEYDDGQKLNIAAAFGNYKGENAGAVGLFYRPDSRTTLSVGGSFGNDDGMVNVGVSYALHKGVGTSKSALQREVKDLKAKLKDYDAMKQAVADMQSKLASLSLISDKRASFPDVPADHWANNAVETLHGNNMIQGYPDGQFKGDKPMTRYEYAEMLFNALSKGGNINREHVQEYAPELRQIAQKAGNPEVLKGYNIAG